MNIFKQLVIKNKTWFNVANDCKELVSLNWLRLYILLVV